MRRNRMLGTVALAAATALAAAACSSSGTSGSASSGSTASANTKLTLTWWHNGNTQPLMGVWQSVAAAYHAAHPNVSFTVSPYQNEQFKTKIPLALKSNNPPDLFQQ